MSATIHALPSPEPRYAPDLETTFKLIDACEGDSGALFDLVRLSTRAVEGHRERGSADPETCQAIMNGLATAFFALATMLDIPRSDFLDPATGGDAA